MVWNHDKSAKKYWKQIVPYVHIYFGFKHLDLYKPCMKVALKGNAITAFFFTHSTIVECRSN